MTRLVADKEFWLAGLRADGAAVRAAVREADLAAPVPSCPGWTVTDLVDHLAGVYGFVCRHLVRGTTATPDPADRPTRPAGGDPRAWWDERFAELVPLLEQTPPDLPAWNWAPRARTAAFWFRRMAHETAIHRWDAQFATVNAEPIDARLAADGIAEVLDTWLPAGRGRHPDAPAGVVALHDRDSGYVWYARLRGDGGIALLDTGTLFDSAEHHERAAAEGRASDILLALYGRVGFDVLDLTGDERLLHGLRTG